MNGLRSRWVRADGVMTHYTESGGDGPVLLSMHEERAGVSGRSSMGRAMLHMPPGPRVLALDSVGGFGLTETDAAVPLGLFSRSDHVNAFIDTLGIERFSILGIGEGAFAAARCAMSRSDLVDGVVLMSTPSVAHAMGVPRPAREPPPVAAYDDEFFEPPPDAAARLAAIARYRAVTATLADDPIRAARLNFRASLPLLAREVPMICIWGETEEAQPELGRALQSLLPEARFHWVPDAGRAVQNDQPRRVADIIATFLRARDQGPAAPFSSVSSMA